MATCMLCGAEYEVCKFCRTVQIYTPWRQECDTQRHWQILMVVRDLRDGRITPSEAKEQLEHLKVTAEEVKTFRPVIQQLLKPCFSAPEPNKAEVEEVKAEEPEADEVTEQPEVEAEAEPEAEPKTGFKSNFRKARNAAKRN